MPIPFDDSPTPARRRMGWLIDASIAAFVLLIFVGLPVSLMWAYHPVWVPSPQLEALNAAPSPAHGGPGPHALSMKRCLRAVLRAAPLSQESLTLCRRLHRQTQSDARAHAAATAWHRQCITMPGVCIANAPTSCPAIEITTVRTRP